VLLNQVKNWSQELSGELTGSVEFWVHAVNQEARLDQSEVRNGDFGEPGSKEVETSVNNPVARPVLDATITPNGTERGINRVEEGEFVETVG